MRATSTKAVGQEICDILGRQQTPLVGALWTEGGRIVDVVQGPDGGPGGRRVGDEAREQWLKLCGQGG